MRIAPFAVFVALLAAAPLAEPWLQARGIDPRWLVVARGLAAGLLLAAFAHRYVELRDLRLRAREAMVAFAAGAALCAVWIPLAGGWMSWGDAGPGFAPLTPEGGTDYRWAGLRLIGFVLVVPLMEELFWRSFLMRWIQRRNFLSIAPKDVGMGAAALSSALFALGHTQWLAGLIAGGAYAILYRRYNNLWVPTIAHATTNGLLGSWILATGSWSYW